MNAPVVDKKPRLTTSAMIASIASEGQRVTAAPFGKALVAYADKHPEVVGLTADLAKYTDLHLFAQAFPERFYQMGMAEQLLMAAAGGMAKEGLTPFATTYAAFATRRAHDFIHQVIAEENLNVKICCALPGLTTGYGPSHAATEDIAMMRGIPGLTIVDPCDALDLEQAVPQIAQHNGPVYMRLLRGNVPLVLDEIDGYQFELGKAKLLRADTVPGALSLDDYCARPHALVSFAGDLTGFIDDELAKIGRERHIVLAVPQFNGLATLLAETDIVASVPDYTAAALTAAGGLRAEDLPLETQTFELHMAWRGAQDNDPAERWLRSRIQMFCGDPDSL
jgi:transketolase